METSKSTEESQSRDFDSFDVSVSFRSLDVQPSSEELETTSEPIPSSDSPRSALEFITAPVVLPTRVPGLTELSEAACFASHQMGHGSLGYQPLYVSYVPRNPCNTADFSSGPATASSYPAHSSGHSSESDPCCGLGQSFEPCQGSGPGPAPTPVPAPTPPASAPGPAHSVFRSTAPCLFPIWNPPPCHWEPHQQPWEALQVSEPGARGPHKPPEVEKEPGFLCKTLPRGQCLLYNWEEERATNHLDQLPGFQDGSESYFFRHGHQGLLTMQLQSPMPSSTTQKDSYQPPRKACHPLRGKREGMLELLLHHQICKEVQAEQEPPRKLVEPESVTHHDYKVELVLRGPPAPTKPHDYRQEQPESFWIQRAPQLPGVSNIKTLDTPFRKNCAFSTPVPLSLGQPLPYELDSGPQQMGTVSSLACQGGGQGCGRERTALL
ncbi:sperm-associated antigen 8 [Acomys russatus]|uniref:sperm-associated antigen 8 n=1 Tax=Acomys russatus TaxID=60746 RepID=UPI0021E2B563|nr:sperm-associated antigen 8 [Acomys russatus]